jgi:cobalt-zinc-cadmium efflux system outer membrane protein
MIARYVFLPLVAAVAAVTVAGCASTSLSDDSFSNVQRAVSGRGGQQIHWNRGSPADKEAADAVRQLLAQPLTSDRAVQFALLNNPNLQATYEDVGVAQADLVGAGLLQNPVFDATVLIPEGGVGATKLDFAVTANFLDVFQIPLRKRLATSALRSAELKTADAVLALAADVREAYAAAVASGQLLELRRTVVEAASASAEVAQRLHDAGNITDLDLANEQALAEAARLELTSAEAEAQAARARLGMLLGVADDAWTLPPRLPDAIDERFATGELEAQSLNRRLDLRAAERRVRNAEQALGGARRFGGLDHVEAGASAEREHDGEWSIGPNLALPIPLFNQGQAKIAAARAELRRSRAQRDALVLAARAEVRTAAAQLDAARERARRLRDIVLPLRKRIVEQTQLQYNAMHVGIFDLLRAKQDEVNAGAEYVSALREYWTARAKLERAAGGDLPGGKSATQPATAPVSAPAPANPHEHHH